MSKKKMSSCCNKPIEIIGLTGYCSNCLERCQKFSYKWSILSLFCLLGISLLGNNESYRMPSNQEVRPYIDSCSEIDTNCMYIIIDNNYIIT